MVLTKYLDVLLKTSSLAAKAKVDKWGYIEHKKLLYVKGHISRLKGQPRKWEQIFTNYISDKDPNPNPNVQMYKELLQLKTKK